jgi:ATP-dependent Clp protease, protease subunit
MNVVLQQVFPKRMLTFFGPINLPNTNHLRANLCQMVNEGAQEITLLFASPGGSTDDGMALFTFLRALPVQLTMHAVGFVSSIAIPVFLAAHHRLASVNSRFFFHDFTFAFPTQIVSRTSTVESSMLMDSALHWTKTILKSTTQLSDEDLERMRLLQEPRLMIPGEALERGIIQEIQEPVLRLDTRPVVSG